MALSGYNPRINSGTLWIGKNLVSCNQASKDPPTAGRSSSTSARWRTLGEIVDHLEREDGRSLDSRSYGELIRQCSSARALEEGRRVHSIIVRSDRWRRETFLGNLLVQMYGSCKSLGDAVSVFQAMPRRNSFSWNIMIAANAQNGQCERARDVFYKMPGTDNISWTSILASLLHSGDFRSVKKIFDEMPERCAVAWNVVLAAYARQGHLLDLLDSFEKMPCRGVDSWNVMIRALDRESAKVVFDRMPGKDVISWNTMLSSCCSSSPSMELDQTKQLFDCMPQHDAISCSTMLSAFAQSGDLPRARQVFDSIGNRDSMAWTTMLTAYLQNHELSKATAFFFWEMPHRDTCAWSLLVAAYAQSGHAKQAVRLLGHMDLEGIRPDGVTYARIFDACAESSSLAEGQLVHLSMNAYGDLESDTVVGTALVCMYGRSCRVDAARAAFDRVARKDVVTWTAMLTVYAHSGCVEEAEALFREAPERNVLGWNAMLRAYSQRDQASSCVRALPQMDQEGILPNESTFITVLDACGCATLAQAKMIHSFVAESGLESRTLVGTGLVNLYAKSGCLHRAREVFHRILAKDLIAWAAMIAAYSRNGRGKPALELFQQLQVEGVEEPNGVVFTSVLSACGSVGLVGDGREYFLSLQADYGISPSMEHYVCMVDLLGRTGRTEEADALLKSMPYEPHVVGWTSVMYTCGKQGDDERALAAVGHKRELET